MATYKEVKQLQAWGKDDEVVSKLMSNGMIQPSIFATDYFHPSQANWSWQIGLVKIDGVTYELLTQFGTVKGGRAVYMPEYNLDKLQREARA